MPAAGAQAADSRAKVVTLGKGAPLRAIKGVLDDGTAFFAPFGEVITDGDLVCCHLCGQMFRSVTAHLRSHGWTKERYCEAFGLERGQSLEGPRTRKLRSAAFTARLIFDPAIREGSAAGRARARTGELTSQAAAAARGRRFPEQRRRKAAVARAAISSDAIARANRDRADRHLAAVAAEVARQQGYPDIAALVAARIQDGASLAAISREAGLDKDWMSRHLARVDPAAALAARTARPDRADAAWLPALRRLGYGDVAAFLRDRHLEQRQTVHAIAGELGVSHHAVATALRRHDIDRIPHSAKRHAAAERAAEVAGRLGYSAITDYISQRRAQGWTWNAIASESGQPQTWLRRHAAGGAGTAGHSPSGVVEAAGGRRR